MINIITKGKVSIDNNNINDDENDDQDSDIDPFSQKK